LGPFRVRAVGFYQNPLVSLGFPSVLAVGAVIGELVSVGPFSLFCGEIQGNLSNFDWRRRLALVFAVEIQSLTSRIP